MNGVPREYFGGLRGLPHGSQHRRGRSVNGDPVDRDESLDLFSRTRQSQMPASSAESDVLVKLGRISVGSTKPLRSGMDDLLSSTDGGKHDYDWLLTPPETPLFSSTDANELQQSLSAIRSNSFAKSARVSKPSRLSVSHSDIGNASRPRSSSVTRPSVSSYSSNSNRTSILNTSTTSITSSRPSTPSSRPSTSRTSVSTARAAPGRPSTPTRIRPSTILSNEKTRAPSISSSDKIRLPSNPRPSTTTSHSQILGNSNPLASRPSSRPSTPTRRNPAPVSASVPGRSSSVGRGPINRNTAPSSRASSPSPRTRPPPQPIVPPDFPLDAPPNLRTTLPDRPVSAGRSRPGAALTVRSNLEPVATSNPPRRSSSPGVTRGRLPELSRRNQVHSNVQDVLPVEMHKPVVSRPVKPASTIESTGFGRTISKKSLDMALKHMDIRHNVGGIRGLSSSSLFPHSIRSSNPKGRPARTSDSPSSVGSNSSENGYGILTSPDNHEPNSVNGRLIAKLSHEPDIYESTRYDAILLKEDLKNTNWLHSVDDKSDQSPLFDSRFEPLPEPFGLI